MEKILGSFRKICVNRSLIKINVCDYQFISRSFNSTAVNSLIYSRNITNRNPRNLERMRISRKPTGYHLDKPGKEFWHKVSITMKSRYVIAKVFHNNGNVVIQASTNEWGLTKHLYRCNDVSAYINLANVLAERCLQSGIHEMINGVDCNNSRSRTEFIKHMEEAGILLTESPTYTPLSPWCRKVDKKPWEMYLD